MDPILTLPKEEYDDLVELWGRSGEAKRIHGVESKEFTTIFELYKEKMRQLGNKYNYNPDDVTISVYGGVYQKRLRGSVAKT